MGGIGYAIGSILTGAGEGLAAQADANQKTALEDMQARRDLAIANLKIQADAANTEAEHTNRIDEINTQGAVNDTLKAHEQARDFAYGTQTNEQKGAIETQQIKLKAGIDLSHDQTMASIQHKYHLDEDQAHDMREIYAQAQKDSTLIDHYEVDKNGHMVGFTKTGKAYQSMTNQYPYSGESSSDDGLGGSIDGELGARGQGSGTPAIPPRPSAQRGSSVKADDSTVLGQLANLPPPPGGRVGATASYTDPNGKRYTAHYNGKTWVLDDVNG